MDNAIFTIDERKLIIILFEKNNFCWYDYAYRFAEESRWMDNDRFGFTFKPGSLSFYYSLSERKTHFEIEGIMSNRVEIEEILKPYFLL